MKYIFVFLFLFSLISCGLDQKPNNLESFVSLDSLNFEDSVCVLDKKNLNNIPQTPIVIYFFDENSKICSKQNLILDSISNDYTNLIKFYKIEKSQKKILSFFDVNKFPCLVFISLDNKVQIIKGFVSSSDIKNAVNTIFNL